MENFEGKFNACLEEEDSRKKRLFLSTSTQLIMPSEPLAHTHKEYRREKKSKLYLSCLVNFIVNLIIDIGNGMQMRIMSNRRDTRSMKRRSWMSFYMESCRNHDQSYFHWIFSISPSNDDDNRRRRRLVFVREKNIFDNYSKGENERRRRPMTTTTKKKKHLIVKDVDNDARRATWFRQCNWDCRTESDNEHDEMWWRERFLQLST